MIALKKFVLNVRKAQIVRRERLNARWTQKNLDDSDEIDFKWKFKREREMVGENSFDWSTSAKDILLIEQKWSKCVGVKSTKKNILHKKSEWKW